MSALEQLFTNKDSYKFLKSEQKYFAHLPTEKSTQAKESLEEHTQLVCSYAWKSIQVYGLEKVIENLIEVSIPKAVEDKKQYADFIRDFFFKVFLYHDFGKVNHAFQRDKMKEDNPKLLKVKHEFGSQHAGISMYIFLMHAFDDILLNVKSDTDQMILVKAAIAFSYPILKHHASDLDRLLNSYDSLKKYPSLKQYLILFKKEITEENLSGFHDLLLDIPEIFKEVNDNEEGKSDKEYQNFFQLIKLSFSLLTASDYLATTHYMSEWTAIPEDFGVISPELRKKIISKVQKSKAYNQSTYLKLAKGFEFICPQDISADNLNILRQEMALEAIQKMRMSASGRIFYLEAPTGGGKTNISMLLIGELLRMDEEHLIKKIFYVFPFTTLITQTYESLVETMGLEEAEIVELHSKAGFKEKDDVYGKDKENYLDYLFANYPITLLSHIKFFDILKSNRKEINYLMHKLANSIVVLDELQSYTPKEWDKIIYLIESYAKLFNIKFILMSATLPKLGNLQHVEEPVVSLIKDKNTYFQNPNFSNRVKFDFSLMAWKSPEKENKSEYLNRLADFVLDKSLAYSNQKQEKEGRCFTIIEFIFKKTASEFKKIVDDETDFFDEVFVLSGTILEHRRREIIHFLKNSKNKDKKVLLITTQVVEAGVDIDMDVGFKDTSIIDSDEQLAGRINRNVNKPECKLYLFDCDDASILYKGDDRYKMMKTELSEEHEAILKNKNFDRLYELVFNHIDRWNAQEQTKGIEEYQSCLAKLSFREVNDECKLINQKNQMVFVPLDLAIKSKVTGERSFTEKELKFLSQYNKHEKGVDEVSGALVWELYEEFIHYKNEDFILQKINMKQLQSIMNKFSFSLFSESKDIKALKSAGNEEKYGFIYLAHHGEFYDVNSGLDAEALENSNFI